MNKKYIVDALPYIDQGYSDDADKKMILSMINEETNRYRNTKNYLEYLGKEELNRFETELMRNEYERIEKNIPLEKFDMSRYDLPEPSIGKQKDLSSWQKSLDNSYAQLEHQQFRILNLKLLDTYGVETWKTYIDTLDKLVQNNKNKLIDIKRKIQETNYERKTSQEKAGDKLKHLEANWVSLVSKNFEIEQVCLNLENEIKMLEKYNQFSKPGEQLNNGNQDKEMNNGDQNKEMNNGNQDKEMNNQEVNIKRQNENNDDEPKAKRQKEDGQEEDD